MTRVLAIIILLTSCQSQDRQWSDMQVIMEHTQPRK